MTNETLTGYMYRIWYLATGDFEFNFISNHITEERFNKTKGSYKSDSRGQVGYIKYDMSTGLPVTGYVIFPKSKKG